ncbi:MAG: potassium-transporting ATPase subunit KdpA [Chloroflexi bacterium]|nr:potassium-transporting ATPase subunit KdpA [Chloroflexota bacterium]
MTLPGIVQIAVFFLLLLLLTKPLGGYMARVYQGEQTWLDPILTPIERAIYRLSGVDWQQEQSWRGYTAAMLLFNLFGLVLTYAILRTQGLLPYNPQELSGATPDLAFNTAVSFATNTNWQSYVGETTMSYFSQMVGLAVHNFTSAAIGMAVAIALVRGIARRGASTIGNFWVDLVRSVLWILLPISVVFAIVLVALGTPQTLGGYVDATTLEGATQTIARGPVASQEIIKELGTNGGGFFNVNSGHPYENPSPLTDLLTNFAIIVIPAAIFFTFGRMVGDTRQGWALWAASFLIVVVGLAVTVTIEQRGNPLIGALGVDQTASALQAGGNMEGKEVRFGVALSALWIVITTATSCGAVNAFHDSLMPLAGLVPMVNMKLGEAVFGGVGAGLYGMLMFAILAVFIAGLMVGRTPEYIGKKIESYEVKMAMLASLILAASILIFTGLASVGEWGTATLNNPGAHGFSEILYLYTSSTANNGSAFAGIGANNVFYNTTGGLAMLFGRFLMIVPMLAIAGSLAAKRRTPPSLGTFPTTGGVWVGLLVGVILIMRALTFFPALSLGPIVEHFQLLAGQTFSS